MGDTRTIAQATIKARIATGTYTLQANRHKFNQYEVSPICPLCNAYPEDRAHFLLYCESTQSIRDPYINKIITFFPHFADNIVSYKSSTLLQSILLIGVPEGGAGGASPAHSFGKVINSGKESQKFGWRRKMLIVCIVFFCCFLTDIGHLGYRLCSSKPSAFYHSAIACLTTGLERLNIRTESPKISRWRRKM